MDRQFAMTRDARPRRSTAAILGSGAALLSPSPAFADASAGLEQARHSFCDGGHCFRIGYSELLAPRS